MKKKAKKRSHKATSAFRVQNAVEKNDAANQKFLETDNVSEFDQILRIDVKNFPSSWNVITHTKSHQILFDEISFDDEGLSTFRFTLTVKDDLSFIMSILGSSIPLSKVNHITKSQKVQRLSDVSNILAFLNSIADHPPTSEEIILGCSKQLTKVIEAEPALFH